jgi:hypothetical protein
MSLKIRWLPSSKIHVLKINYNSTATQSFRNYVVLEM